jgi:hypothetical protein
MKDSDLFEPVFFHEGVEIWAAEGRGLLFEDLEFSREDGDGDGDLWHVVLPFLARLVISPRAS